MRRLALIVVMAMSLAACGGADEPATSVTVLPESTGSTVHTDDSMSDDSTSDGEMADGVMTAESMTYASTSG